MSIDRPRFAAASVAAASVLATSITAISVLVPAPASAAVTGTVESGTASWGISGYLNSTTPGRPNPSPANYVAPASITGAVSSWGGGTGLVAPDGSADLAFAGTSVNHATTGGGWLTLKDLQADLDASGNGVVSAVVSYGTSSPPATFDPSQTPVRGPERVPVVALAGNTAADRTLAADAATWTGLDGTWAPQLLDFLDGEPAGETTPAIAGWAYASTITNNVNNPGTGAPYVPARTPEPFTFTVATAAPEVTATITETTPAGGVKVTAAGDGFRAVTNPGDAGVYVGIAPSGGLPDVSDPANAAAFADVNYLPPPALMTGAFTTDLVAETDALDPSKTYSVYTWQSHTHSNTTQDTETPIAIDFEALKQATTTTVTGASTQVYGRTSTITAAVDAPGSVTLTGVGAAQTVEVAEGAAGFTVPASLPAGSYTATVTYGGSPSHLTSSATHTLIVTKAASRTLLTITQKPTGGVKGKAGKATVVVSGPAAVAAPTGQVTVKLTKPGGKTRRVVGRLVGGKATVTIPRLGKGAWTAVATYGGTASLVTSKQTKRFTAR